MSPCSDLHGLHFAGALDFVQAWPWAVGDSANFIVIVGKSPPNFRSLPSFQNFQNKHGKEKHIAPRMAGTSKTFNLKIRNLLMEPGSQFYIRTYWNKKNLQLVLGNEFYSKLSHVPFFWVVTTLLLNNFQALALAFANVLMVRKENLELVSRKTHRQHNIHSFNFLVWSWVTSNFLDLTLPIIKKNVFSDLLKRNTSCNIDSIFMDLHVFYWMVTLPGWPGSPWHSCCFSGRPPCLFGHWPLFHDGAGSRSL